jgi:hypothetical protein
MLDVPVRVLVAGTDGVFFFRSLSWTVRLTGNPLWLTFFSRDSSLCLEQLLQAGLSKCVKCVVSPQPIQSAFAAQAAAGREQHFVGSRGAVRSSGPGVL